MTIFYINMFVFICKSIVFHVNKKNISFDIFLSSVAISQHRTWAEKMFKGDMDNIYTSGSLGGALTLACPFYFAGF